MIYAVTVTHVATGNVITDGEPLEVVADNPAEAYRLAVKDIAEGNEMEPYRVLEVYDIRVGSCTCYDIAGMRYRAKDCPVHK